MTVRVPSRIDFLPIERLARILLKKLIPEHGSQHCTAYITQVFHIDTSILCSLNHFFIIVSVTAVGCYSGSQRLIGSLDLILCRIMLTGSQVTYSTTITDNKTIESPFLT